MWIPLVQDLLAMLFAVLNMLYIWHILATEYKIPVQICIVFISVQGLIFLTYIHLSWWSLQGIAVLSAVTEHPTTHITQFSHKLCDW